MLRAMAWLPPGAAGGIRKSFYSNSGSNTSFFFFFLSTLILKSLWACSVNCLYQENASFSR